MGPDSASRDPASTSPDASQPIALAPFFVTYHHDQNMVKNGGRKPNAMTRLVLNRSTPRSRKSLSTPFFTGA